MAGLTIDQFDNPNPIYADANLFGLGQGVANPIKTYKGNLLDLFKYIQRKADSTENSMYGPSVTMINGIIQATVGSNILTVALKNELGADPSDLNPVYIISRNPALNAAPYIITKVTAALSKTLTAGQTVGTVNNVAFNLQVCAVIGPPIQLGLINSYNSALQQYTAPFESILWNTTGGGGNSYGVMYTTSSLTSKPITNLAILNWPAGLPIAGQWSVAPNIQPMTAGQAYALAMSAYNNVDGGTF